LTVAAFAAYRVYGPSGVPGAHRAKGPPAAQAGQAAQTGQGARADETADRKRGHQAGHTRVPPGHHGAHAQPVEHGLDGHVLLILGVVGRVVRIVLWPAALAVRVAFTLR